MPQDPAAPAPKPRRPRAPAAPGTKARSAKPPPPPSPAPPTAGGGAGHLLNDPKHVRGDLITIRTAARYWDLGADLRQKLVTTLEGLLEAKNRRVRVSAARTLAALVASDRQEVLAEVAQAKLALQRLRTATAAPAADPHGQGDPDAVARAEAAAARARAEGLTPTEVAARALHAALHDGPEGEDTAP